MDKNKAATLARTLMNKHGLTALPFEFNRGKRMIGMAQFYGNDKSGWKPVKISLSSYWTEAMDEAEIRDTILHEIAHVLAGRSAHHNWQWKAIARQVGARPQRCAAPSAEAKEVMGKIAPPAWLGTCRNGHTSTPMHRAPGRVKACGRCSNRFDIANVFEWSKNGKPVPHEQVGAKYAAEFNRYKMREIMRGLPGQRKF